MPPALDVISAHKPLLTKVLNALYTPDVDCIAEDFSAAEIMQAENLIKIIKTDIEDKRQIEVKLVPELSMSRFHNALRIMKNLDRDELIAAGVISADEDLTWNAYCGNQGDFVIKLPTPKAESLWTLIESRQPKNLAPQKKTKEPVNQDDDEACDRLFVLHATMVIATLEAFMAMGEDTGRDMPEFDIARGLSAYISELAASFSYPYEAETLAAKAEAVLSMYY